MKVKIAFFTLCGTIACVLPIRIWQYFNKIDFNTGFYTSNDLSQYLLTGLLIFASIAIFLLSFQSKKGFKQKQFPNQKNIFFGVILVLVALSFLMFIGENMYVTAINGGTTNFPIFALYIVLSLLAVVGFILIAIHFFKGSSKPINSYVALFPIPIVLIRLFETYISHINIINISEFPYIMLMIISSLLFYMSFARIIAGYKSPKIYASVCFFAGVAAIFSFVSAGSRMIVNYMNGSLIAPENMPMYVDILTGILAISFLGCFAFSKEKSIDEENTDEIDDDIVLINTISSHKNMPDEIESLADFKKNTEQ